jgi:hypothetical protein
LKDPNIARAEAHAVGEPLTLEVQVPSNPKPKATPKPKAPAKPREPKQARKRAVPPERGEAHAKVVACYFEVFESTRGEKPPFGGADATAAKRLLDQLDGDAEKACRAITTALSDPFQGARMTIRTVASDPAKWLGPPRVQRTTNNNHRPPQPDYGPVERYGEELYGHN